MHKKYKENIQLTTMTNKSTPLVSIIIPTYNNGRFISFAIDSALNQTYRNLEIIVVNDGSIDDTKEIIKQYQGRIKYIYQANQGPASARNKGIKESQGKYLQFLDADDLISSEKIEKQVEFLEKEKYPVVVYSDVRYFRDYDIEHLIDLSFPHYTGYIFSKLLDSNFIPVNAPLFTRLCFEQVGLFKGNKTYLYGVEDWEFLLRLASNDFEFKYLDEILALCRFHSDNISLVKLRMKKSGIDVIKEVKRHVPQKEFRRRLEITKHIRWREYDYGIRLIDNGFYKEGRRQILKSLISIDILNLGKLIFLILSFLSHKKATRDKLMKPLNLFYFRIGMWHSA